MSGDTRSAAAKARIRDRRQRALEMSARGMTHKEIARALGVRSPSVVCDILKAAREQWPTGAVRAQPVTDLQ